MSRPYAADDSDAITARQRELRAERDAAFAGCACPDAIGADGAAVKAHAPGCPHYQPPPETGVYGVSPGLKAVRDLLGRVVP